jgi:hypothetical protein
VVDRRFSLESVARLPVEVATFGGEGRDLTEHTRELFQEALDDDALFEPLARQIFLEAVALQEDEPRAAFVLALVAAEVGLKQFAIRETPRPSEQWLLDETAHSPSFRKLLKEYLPRATERRTTDGRIVPSHLQEALGYATDTRDNIVHRGVDAPGEEKVAEVLAAVNDFLYLLDWLAGHQWAYGWLTTETQAAFPSAR